jgi:ubiquinone/menaquinone biosynthesis C-methylase UbiE
MTTRGPATVGGLYDGLEVAWATGAEPVYGPMAAALVGHSPIDLAGRLVLDVGAGTGAGSRALEMAGARPVAMDLAHSMLAHDRAHRPPAVVGDLFAPPFRPGGLGGVMAPFVINHVDEPAAAFWALARCIEPGGVLLASTFAESDRPPLKDAIDGVVLRHGCVLPEEYVWVRERSAPLTGSAAAMAEVASAAGLDDIDVVERAVDTGVSAPAQLVAYRFALPHVTRFLASVDDETRAAIVAEAEAEVASRHDGSSLAPVVVLLAARVR